MNFALFNLVLKKTTSLNCAPLKRHPLKFEFLNSVPLNVHPLKPQYFIVDFEKFAKLKSDTVNRVLYDLLL